MPEDTALETRVTAETLASETRRVQDVYRERRRGGDAPDHRLAVYKRCAVDEREELLIRALQEMGVMELAGMKILDVGCGGGMLIRHMFDFGADPALCFGIDLDENHIRIAKRLAPEVGFLVANAAEMPFSGESFDLVFQFMLFTSILNPAVRRAIASEILRVLRPGGLLAWFDFRYDNPRNANVKGIGKHEILALLPGCRLQFWKVTLAPPIGRVAARVSPFLYQALSRVPWLKTHYLCVARKP